jgi:hypothetical protein
MHGRALTLCLSSSASAVARPVALDLSFDRKFDADQCVSAPIK